MMAMMLSSLIMEMLEKYSVKIQPQVFFLNFVITPNTEI